MAGIVTPSPRGIRKYEGSSSMARKRLKFESTDGNGLSQYRSLPNRADELGESHGTCTAKKTIVWNGIHHGPLQPTPVAQDFMSGNKTLSGSYNKFHYNNLYYTTDLLDQIEYGSAPDQRERGCINLRGFHIKLNALNSNPYTAAQLHVALVQPQGFKPGLDGSELKTDFFRHYTSNRARDFNHASNPYNLSGLEMCHNPINTDRYNVLMHKKIDLGPGGGRMEFTAPLAAAAEPYRSGDTPMPNYALREYWIPINKQIRYVNPTSPSSIAEGDALHLVWWFAQPFSYSMSLSEVNSLPDADKNKVINNYKSGRPSEIVADFNHPCLFQCQVLAYHRDPKN